MISFTQSISVPLVILSLGLSVSAEQQNDASKRYDRLDGMGASGKKVDIIEWAGNIEIHVEPPGSLAGLGLKMVEKDGKKVMVASYRFANVVGLTKPLIRRFLVSVPLREDFKVYKDNDAAEYDKIIISNHSLAGNVVLMRLDPTPTQLYPDGHPALATKKLEEPQPNRIKARVPAADERKTEKKKDFDADTGTIKPYSWVGFRVRALIGFGITR